MSAELKAAERRLERSYRRYAETFGVALDGVTVRLRRTADCRIDGVVTLAGDPDSLRRLKAAVDRRSPALKALRRRTPVTLGLELAA
jgi:hypothetical protein